jgi:hypothetical protein
MLSRWQLNLLAVLGGPALLSLALGIWLWIGSDTPTATINSKILHSQVQTSAAPKQDARPSSVFVQARGASSESPFGLHWGASPDEVKSTGLQLKQQQGDVYGPTYSASKPRNAIHDQGLTILSFDYSGKLWRVVALSIPFENDPYGKAGKSRYADLLRMLDDKYGRGQIEHRLGRGIYAEAEYFVAGIRSDDSMWFANFETSTIFVQLSLVATDNSTLHWRIIYENKNLRTAFEQDQKNREKRSL